MRQGNQGLLGLAFLATVSLAALRLALGVGRWRLKLPTFVLLAAATGTGLCWLEVSISRRAAHAGNVVRVA